LVEGSAAEPVVRRAVVVGMVGHWLELEDECALALTRLTAWLAGHRRQPLQRAEDDACGEDDARKKRR
jgi:hypothetical protein